MLVNSFRGVNFIFSSSFLISIEGNMSAAWPSGSERRFYDGHDCKVDGSTFT